MFLSLDASIRERIFQPFYDWLYKYSGHTQYNYATFTFILALVLYVTAFVMAASSRSVAALLLPSIGFLLVVWWGRALYQAWEQSEKGWEERTKDTSGNKYQAWLPWGMLRMTFALASLVEAALALLQGGTFFMHSEIYYAAMYAFVVASLYFCSCNRSFLENRKVIP